MLETPREYIQNRFDARNAPEKVVKLVEEIVSGKKRSLSVPQSIKIYENLKEFPLEQRA